MKKLLLAMLVLTGISSIGCHRVLDGLHQRHVVHRRHIGAALVGAAVVGAALHHAAHHHVRPTVVYHSDHCDY
jgi:hypothetical protein